MINTHYIGGRYHYAIRELNEHFKKLHSLSKEVV
jgi:hypothetical protein